jgi:hypothetical protein
MEPQVTKVLGLGDTRILGIPQGPGGSGDLFFIKDKIKHVIYQSASF